MQADPRPPLLVIRSGVAFFVEQVPVSSWTASPQAFDDGCYSEAYCVEQSGDAWRIADARMRTAPTLLNRLMPWRRVPVEITLTAMPRRSVDQVVTSLNMILESKNEFCDSLGNRAAVEELKTRLRACTTLVDLFNVASRYVKG